MEISEQIPDVIQHDTASPLKLTDAHAQEDLLNLLSITPAAIVIVDASQKIRLANMHAESTFRIRPADIGRGILEVFDPPLSNEIASRLSEVITTGRSHEIEVDDLNGHPQLIRMKPYRTAANHHDGAILSFQDIHRLRSAQTDAKHAHIFTKSLVGTVPTPLVVLQEDFRVQMVNEAFHTHFGTQPVDLEEQLFLEIQQSRFDLGGIRAALTRILAEQTPLETLEIEEETRAGKKHVSITVRLIKPATEKLLLVALNDITARKEAEQLLLSEHNRLKRQVEDSDTELERTKLESQMALHESRIQLLRSREELRHLTASLLHAQDEERRRVSRELHDDLSQRVAKLQFEIEMLVEQVPFTDLEDARQRLRTVRDEVASLADDLRRVAHQLHPSILDHLGLAVALRSYINEFVRSTQIRVDLSTDAIPKDLPPEIASCAYRVTQETLRNVAKHAGTDRAEVALRVDDNFLALHIRDEGKGFHLSNARAKGGLGLVGIEERIRLVGGTIRIDAAPDCGSSILVRLPLQSAALPVE